MAEEEENNKRRSKLPFLCGIGCIIIVTCILLTTEWLTDASVMLNKWRLVCLVIILIPFILIGIDLGVVGGIISVIVFLIVLGLSISLYIDRNNVVKIYIEESKISDAQAAIIEGMLGRPILVSIGGNVTELPDKLKKYNEFDDDAYKKLHDRLKPDEAPSKNLNQKDLSPNRMNSARLSGIIERAIVVMPSAVVTDETYKSHGYNEIPASKEGENEEESE